MKKTDTDEPRKETAFDAARDSFYEALRSQNLLASEDGFRGFFGLTESMRLFLAFLDREERALAEAASYAAPSETLHAPMSVTEAGLDSRQGPELDTIDQVESLRGDFQPVQSKSTEPAKAEPVKVERPALVAEPMQECYPAKVGGSGKANVDSEGVNFLAPEVVPTPSHSPDLAISEPKGPIQAPLSTRALQQPKVSSQEPSIAGKLIRPTQAPQRGGATAMPGRISHGGGSGVSIESLKKVVYLKNARINEPYLGFIEVPGISSLRLIDDGKTGLLLDEKGGSLHGTVSISGDFVLVLHGLVDGRSYAVIANLAVIPDPRSLWVSKDSDCNSPFWKPDEATTRSDGDLLCVAASQRGRSHAREGIFRDDDFALWSGGPGGWNLAVVADGAGSAKFSRFGSKIAVDAIVKELPRLLDEHLSGQLEKLISDLQTDADGAEFRIRSQLYLALGTAAFKASQSIREQAGAINENASALSTTIVLTVARKGPYGWFVAGFSIGDGGAAIFDFPSRTVIPLTLADSGEFAGQTRFLHHSEFTGGFDAVSKRLFFTVRNDFTAILVMTDGVTDPKFPTDSAFIDPKTWTDFWENDLSPAVRLNRENQELEQELLEWLGFWSPGNHDDRTLAILLP